MKNIVLILLVILVEPFDAQDISGRLMMMDNHMRRLNLTDIHFTDPGDFVKVDTVINEYNPNGNLTLIQKLQKKVLDTAKEMVNSNPQQVEEWKKQAVKLPRPVFRNITSYLLRRAQNK